ncbi:MAG: hypothetical protein IK066_08845 [Kiritimatiellae bacterium]|nr:hypothetical protein [Kiritimatiellia bacterium]
MPEIQVAQGYPNDKLAGYIKTHYSPRLLEAIHQRTYLGQMTTNSFYDGIIEMGDTVTIARSPKVHTEPYVEGGDYTFESSAEKPINLTINRGRQWSKFLDDKTLKRTHIKTLISDILNTATLQIAEDQETEYFGEFGTFVPTCNMGTSAGIKSHAYNLGTLDHPVIVDKTNVLDWLQQFTSVINETGVKNASNNRCVVIPEVVSYLLNISPNLRNASEIGGKSSLRTQYLTELPAIGRIYSSNLLGRLPNGAFPVICQTREAMAYATVAKDSKVVEPSNKHGKFARGYVIYDWDPVREEGLAIGYAKADGPTFQNVA